MKPSSGDVVRKMYDETADSYSTMMDAEIELPVYPDMLGRMQECIENISGTVIDTACGSGLRRGVGCRRTQVHELASWTKEAGFRVIRCVVESIEEMQMNAVYLEGIK